MKKILNWALCAAALGATIIFPLSFAANKFREHGVEHAKQEMKAQDEQIAREAKVIRAKNITIDTTKVIMLSNWCVLHYPEQEQAEYIFNGMSLCAAHFKKEIERYNDCVKRANDMALAMSGLHPGATVQVMDSGCRR